MELYKHKKTSQLMIIDKMHGDIATCTLLTPTISKVLLNKPLNYVAICHIDNLELVKSKNL